MKLTEVIQLMDKFYRQYGDVELIGHIGTVGDNDNPQITINMRTEQ